MKGIHIIAFFGGHRTHRRNKQFNKISQHSKQIHSTPSFFFIPPLPGQAIQSRCVHSAYFLRSVKRFLRSGRAGERQQSRHAGSVEFFFIEGRYSIFSGRNIGRKKPLDLKEKEGLVKLQVYSNRRIGSTVLAASADRSQHPSL